MGVLVAVLIFYMPPTETPVLDKDWLQSVANQWIETGIMSENERGLYLFLHPSRFLDDYQEMIDRAKEMELDCPPEADRFRLPSSPQCEFYHNEALDRVNKLRNLAATLPWHEQYELLPIYEEQCRREEFWRRARYTHWDFSGHRLPLQQLRQFIGREVYDKGEWPSPIVDFRW